MKKRSDHENNQTDFDRLTGRIVIHVSENASVCVLSAAPVVFLYGHRDRFSRFSSKHSVPPDRTYNRRPCLKVDISQPLNKS